MRLTLSRNKLFTFVCFSNLLRFVLFVFLESLTQFPRIHLTSKMLANKQQTEEASGEQTQQIKNVWATKHKFVVFLTVWCCKFSFLCLTLISQFCFLNFSKTVPDSHFRSFFQISKVALPFCRIPILSRKITHPKQCQIPILSNSHFIKNVL